MLNALLSTPASYVPVPGVLDSEGLAAVHLDTAGGPARPGAGGEAGDVGVPEQLVAVLAAEGGAAPDPQRGEVHHRVLKQDGETRDVSLTLG